MERRAFLELFFAAAAAHAVQVPTLEQVLEQPEARLYTEEEIRAAFAQVADCFFRASPILSYMRAQRLGEDYQFEWLVGERA